MSGLFYNLGRKAGPHVRKAKWIWQSMTGTEEEIIKIEQQVGYDLAVEIRQQLKHAPDAKMEQFLNEVGMRLAGRVANRLRKFSFAFFAGGEPNAFALPGGYIFVTRSIVELCEWNKDEIAFIIGHEMAHVIRKHAINRIITNSAISFGSRAVPIQGAAAIFLKTMGIKFLESSYSQEMEMEADKLGTRLAIAAGFDANAATALLGRLARLKNAESQSGIGDYFSSHPSFNARIQNINRLLKNR